MRSRAKFKNIYFAAQIEQPAPIHFTITTTSSHSCYHLSGPFGWSHSSSKPFIGTVEDGLVTAARSALAMLTNGRRLTALTALRAWEQASSPTLLPPDVPPMPERLPITIATTHPDLIRDQLQDELATLDVKWEPIIDGSSVVDYLHHYAALATPSNWILERNQESEREYERNQSMALSQLSEE